MMRFSRSETHDTSSETHDASASETAAASGAVGSSAESGSNVMKNVEDLARYRDTLITENAALDDDIARIEEDNHALAREVKEYEIRLLEKSSVKNKIMRSADKIKKALAGNFAQENSVASEVWFLESEKSRLADEYDKLVADLNDNITILGSLILDADFIRGETVALKDKVALIEDEIPFKFEQLHQLEEKIAWTSVILERLYKSMKAAEKKTKMFYYSRR
jgi:chromosome segregation ATPase